MKAKNEYSWFTGVKKISFKNAKIHPNSLDILFNQLIVLGECIDFDFSGMQVDSNIKNGKYIQQGTMAYNHKPEEEKDEKKEKPEIVYEDCCSSTNCKRSFALGGIFCCFCMKGNVKLPDYKESFEKLEYLSKNQEELFVDQIFKEELHK